MRFTQKQMKQERKNAIARYRRWSVVKLAFAFLLGISIGAAAYHYKNQITTTLDYFLNG